MNIEAVTMRAIVFFACGIAIGSGAQAITISTDAPIVMTLSKPWNQNARSEVATKTFAAQPATTNERVVLTRGGKDVTPENRPNIVVDEPKGSRVRTYVDAIGFPAAPKSDGELFMFNASDAEVKRKSTLAIAGASVKPLPNSDPRKATILLLPSALADDFADAAARVSDPLTFDPGETVEIRSALGAGFSIASNSNNERDIGVFEMDFFTGDLGQTMAYSLYIGVAGGLSSLDDLVVEFTSNPSLGLDDASIVQDLRDALSFSSSRAFLEEDFALPTVFLGPGIVGGPELVAMIEARTVADVRPVPLPAAWLLYGAAAAATTLLGAARRRPAGGAVA
jgi:hypothetical protein